MASAARAGQPAATPNCSANARDSTTSWQRGPAHRSPHFFQLAHRPSKEETRYRPAPYGGSGQRDLTADYPDPDGLTVNEPVTFESRTMPVWS